MNVVLKLNLFALTLFACFVQSHESDSDKCKFTVSEMVQVIDSARARLVGECPRWFDTCWEISQYNHRYGHLRFDTIVSNFLNSIQSQYNTSTPLFHAERSLHYLDLYQITALFQQDDGTVLFATQELTYDQSLGRKVTRRNLKMIHDSADNAEVRLLLSEFERIAKSRSCFRGEIELSTRPLRIMMTFPNCVAVGILDFQGFRSGLYSLRTYDEFRNSLFNLVTTFSAEAASAIK